MHVISPARLRVPLVALAVLALLVQACGDRGRPSAGTAAEATTAAAPASAVPTPREPSPSASAGPSRSPDGSADRPDLAAAHVAVEVVADGLDSPLWVDRIPDGSGRLAVAEQGGKIRIVEGGRLLPDPYLDITDRTLSGGERGLLGVAFPPGFGDQDPTMFVHYSDLTGNTTIAAFDAPAGSTTLDPGTGRILFTADQPYRQPQRRLDRLRSDGDAPDRAGRRRRRR